MKLQIKIATLALVITGLASCKKNFENPNAPTFEETFSNERAVAAVAAGLQRQYSITALSTLYNMVNANGFTSNELVLRNAGNIPELQLATGGGSVDATNTVLANIWVRSNKIVWEADNVIRYANSIGDKSYASGLISFASIFKALSLGAQAMYWERIPDTVGLNIKPTFITRQQGFQKAVAVLNNAIAAYNSNTPNPVILGRLPAGINIPNTLQALRARYALFAGENSTALNAANAVSLTTTSVFNFDNLTQNPVFETATATNNVFQPVDSTLGLPPALAPNLADKRIPFHTSISVNPRYRIRGFYATGTTAVPVYLPGEIILIKAEALARQNDLPNALIELNRVITKKPADDVYGVGADLPPVVLASQADILTEIYRQRSIELFMSGMRLEDQRRLGRPVSERKRNFFPYPFSERDNNPNTPPDPAF